MTQLPYNPKNFPRELKPFYISATDDELQNMLETVGVETFEDLFSHLPPEIMMDGDKGEIGKPLEYQALAEHVQTLAQKNRPPTSFLGDGLKQFKVHEIVPYVSTLRGLTTAYTPYQPERSQGTLLSLWIYASALKELTGFEAINASFYERSTCLSEALNTALRIKRKASTTIVSGTLYPTDIEVLKTLAKETKLNIEVAPVVAESGLTDIDWIENRAKELGDDLAAVAFPQVNSLGVLEDVNALTDLCWEHQLQSIAVIDPLLLAGEDGLIPPTEYGSQNQGTHMLVGEGQHLAIGPNFGGPGLGIFGIRFNKDHKTAIRSTAGRYVGKGHDAHGNEALSLVISTREQHIRREKATSNICSNQSFLATLAGASMLARGDAGLARAHRKARSNALSFAREIHSRQGIELSYPSSPFFHELSVRVKKHNVDNLIQQAREKGLHLGVNVSERIGDGDQHLLMSFSDLHEQEEMEKLFKFLREEFPAEESSEEIDLPDLPHHFIRGESSNLPQYDVKKLQDYYSRMSGLNLSPDDNLYPLGSCTMKYNPHINDYAATLPGFTDLHPQAPLKDCQGSLEILYEIQEMFKSITGLPAVTTQPVAGAQGELVGLKLFQAYHRDRGEASQRQLILIPRSAHGTNPATATMAGFQTKKSGGLNYGIVTLEADDKGQIDLDQVKQIMHNDGHRVAGIMVTNPNTSGIFENHFHTIAGLIHEYGGLVYMDGANMNAISKWVDLEKLGVDAVHNNLHKTWTVPHGGGGPGDAIVAVSERLKDYLPGEQVYRDGKEYKLQRPAKSIGSVHRHFGNFAHKVRTYTYLKALGDEGVGKMSAVAVLSSRYLYERLRKTYPTLPFGAKDVPRMHEFILTLDKITFQKAVNAGLSKAQVIPQIGKLFLDFGLHAPTVAFPEFYGLMVEPTESFTQRELDHFAEVVEAIYHLVSEYPDVLNTAPHFTPVRKVDEVEANKNLQLAQDLHQLPPIYEASVTPKQLNQLSASDVCERILSAHREEVSS